MYKIAHISDLHISKITLNPLQFLSKRWIGNLNLLLKRQKVYKSKQLWDLPSLFDDLNIQTVLVSGDITCTSYQKEFLLAKELFSLIKKRDINIFLVPGNHDRYTKKSCKQHRFYDFFTSSKIPSSHPSKHFTLKKERIEARHLFDKWWYMGIDTSRATHWFSSQGYFSKELENNFTKILSLIPEDAWIILVNHFPFSQKERRKNILKRGNILKKLLQKNEKIKLYLHGHTHKHKISDLRKEKKLPIILDCGSTAHNEIGSWNLLELTKTGCYIQIYNWKRKENEGLWQKGKKVYFAF